MALKIRMRKQGRRNRPFFRIVVSDIRCKRDGKYVEALGWYNPVEAEAEKNLNVKGDRILYWLEQGALISERVEALVDRASPSLLKSFRAAKLEAKKA